MQHINASLVPLPVACFSCRVQQCAAAAGVVWQRPHSEAGCCRQQQASHCRQHAAGHQRHCFCKPRPGSQSAGPLRAQGALLNLTAIVQSIVVPYKSCGPFPGSTRRREGVGSVAVVAAASMAAGLLDINSCALHLMYVYNGLSRITMYHSARHAMFDSDKHYRLCAAALWSACPAGLPRSHVHGRPPLNCCTPLRRQAAPAAAAQQQGGACRKPGTAWRGCTSGLGTPCCSAVWHRACRTAGGQPAGAGRAEDAAAARGGSGTVCCWLMWLGV